jgi:tetratricopeptide (TPR) repeat protein
MSESVDWFNPTDDQLRSWASDRNAESTEDWDVVLAHDPRPVYLELASDPACPNRSFFVRVLYIAAEPHLGGLAVKPTPGVEELVSVAARHEEPITARWALRVANRVAWTHSMLDIRALWHWGFVAWEKAEGHLSWIHHEVTWPLDEAMNLVSAAGVDLVEGRLDQARHRLERASEIESARPHALFVLAALEESIGNEVEAEGLIADVLRMHPQGRLEAAAQLHQSRLHLAARRPNALQELEQARERLRREGVDFLNMQRARDLWRMNGGQD